MHDSIGWLESALILLTAALIVVPIVQRAKLSPVLGYLTAGVLIGPSGFNLIEESATQEQLAEFGVVFLLFTLGLELSIERLSALRSYIFGLGAAQVGLTGAAFCAFNLALGLPMDAALVIGFGLALSSTAVVVQVLSERQEMLTRLGRVTFSILLFQDLAVAPLLALVPVLGQAETEMFTTEAMQAVAQAVAALIGIVLVGRFMLRPALGAVAVSQNRELFIGVVLLIALGTGWATHSVGLSMALGAFLAGLMVAETEYRHQVEADIEPFRGILLGLFFITVGMLIDVPLLFDQIGVVMLGVCLVIGGKLGILFLLGRVSGLPQNLALRVGFNLCQSGEFAFALFTLAIAQGVLPPDIGSTLIVIVAITVALTPTLAYAGERLTKYLSSRRQTLSAGRMEEETTDLRDHVIIAGFGRIGRLVAKMMIARNVPYIAFEIDPGRVTEARAEGWNVFFGDVSRPDLFERANAGSAAGVVITVDQTHTAQRLTSLLHAAHPKLYIVARARDLGQANNLESAGADHIVLETLEAGLELSRSVLFNMGMPESDVIKSMRKLRKAEEWSREIVQDGSPAQPGESRHSPI